MAKSIKPVRPKLSQPQPLSECTAEDSNPGPLRQLGASAAKDPFGATVRLRKMAFAGGLLRLERLRLTLGVRDGALAAGKPGEAGGEDEGE